jgi:uncharacterized protein YkwD
MICYNKKQKKNYNYSIKRFRHKLSKPTPTPKPTNTKNTITNTQNTTQTSTQPTITSTQPTISSTKSAITTVSVTTPDVVVITPDPTSSNPDPTSESIPTPSPQQVMSRIVNYFENNLVNALTLHNNERRLQNLTDFTWSTVMEEEAKKLSFDLAENDNCSLIHRLDTARGQNLFGIYGTTTSSLETGVQAWIDEKSLIGTNASIHEVGHYLNIISPELLQVGCASAFNILQNCLVTTCNYI